VPAPHRPPRSLAFEDLGRAIERAGADVAIIATPVEHHPAACETALTRGLAVLVEKPFTQRLGEAARLVTLADRLGRPFMVAQNYRYMRAFRTMRRLVAADRLGRVSAIHAHYYRVPHEMAPSLAELPFTALYGVAVHHLDAIRWILNDQATEVSAMSAELPSRPSGRGASLDVHLRFAGGARATYSASYESSGHEYFEGGQEFYARLIGDRATLHAVHRWLFLCEGRKLPRPVARGRRAVSEERVLLDQMSRWLATHEPAETSARDNLQTMALVEACLQAARNRAAVNPQELLRDALDAARAGDRH
jgi:predicted dehydrogenase